MTSLDAPASTPGAGWSERLARRLGSLTGRTVLIFLGLRALSGVLILTASRLQVAVPGWTDRHPGYFDMVGLWDGVWYRQIAESGYPVTLPPAVGGHTPETAWAFYPMLSWCSAAVMRVTGLDFAVVASFISLAAGCVAAVLMVRLLSHYLPTAAALGAVAVWAASPAAPVLQIAYTESIAVMLLCGFFLALRRDRALPAVAIALLLGFTRPLAPPLLIVVAVRTFVRWRSTRDRTAVRTGLVVGASLVAAMAEFPLFAWASTGEASTSTRAVSAWGDGGAVVPFKAWVELLPALAGDGHVPFAVWLGAVIGLGSLVVALVGLRATALPLELRVWTVTYVVYMIAVTEPYTGWFRYLLPAFPLAVLVLGAGKPDRQRSWGLWVLAIVTVELLLQALWVSGILVFDPPVDWPP